MKAAAFDGTSRLCGLSDVRSDNCFLYRSFRESLPFCESFSCSSLSAENIAKDMPSFVIVSVFLALEASFVVGDWFCTSTSEPD